MVVESGVSLGDFVEVDSLDEIDVAAGDFWGKFGLTGSVIWTDGGN